MLRRQAARNTSRPKTFPIALRTLTIKNYKALDQFHIEFPKPRMKQDSDIFVMGSKNGLGKTSILECGTILFLAALLRRTEFEFRLHSEMPVDLCDLLIRAGCESAEITGEFEIRDRKHQLRLLLKRNGIAHIEGNTDFAREYANRELFNPPEEILERLTNCLIGHSADPLLLPPLLYFHSYRKVQEGNPELGMMVYEGRRALRRARFRPGYEMPISTFKLEILRSMMSRADLFEKVENQEANEILNELNELVERYAGGKITKLRPSSDNTVNFRIHPTTLGARDSFTFDGLSSGQKEIISTLFLVWFYSHATPGIVLIDEPELHLNVEWHRDFIAQVTKLAPDNQYIIATHSEDIFSSVASERRALLEAGNGSRR